MEMDVPSQAEQAKPGEIVGFQTFPKGDYEAMATKCTEGNSEKCGGKFYQFEITIVTGEFRGKTTSLMLSFLSPYENLRAESMTHYANLKAATGFVLQPGAKIKAEDLLNKPFRMSLDCYTKRGTTEVKNKITNIVPRHSGPGKTVDQTPANTSPAATDPAAKPW